MTDKKADKFYITTAIPYMNAKVHVGNSLEYVLADCIARASRLSGRETFFLTGTDEHGQKIADTAKTNNMAPAEFVQQNVDYFQSVLRHLNISNDDFIRTTDQRRHWPVVTAFWNKLKANGDIYAKDYEGLYCVGCESFITKSELNEAGECLIHKKKPELVKEKNYFFKLSKYQSAVEDYLKNNVEPAWRAKEMINFVKEGLEDISFSRPKEKLSWGIPVPGDDSQVIYVWCDALTNYLSAVSEVNNKGEIVSARWPANLHVVGKDIAKFHTIYWPAMLTAIGLPVADKVLIHGFITINGHKISKSLGNIISPEQASEQFGVDALRYYFLREVPTTDDGDFSFDHLAEVYKGVLADSLGNLVQRLLVMASKYEVDWHFPVLKDKDLANLLAGHPKCQEILALVLHYKVKEGADKLFRAFETINAEISVIQPWELFKTDKEQTRQHLHEWLDELLSLSFALEPFMPDTATKIQAQLKSRQPEPLFVK